MKTMGKEDGEIKLCGWHVSRKKLRKKIKKNELNSKWRRRRGGKKLDS